MSQGKPKIFTYHTRLSQESNQTDVLIAYAEHMSHIERKLFADIQRGKKANDLK